VTSCASWCAKLRRAIAVASSFGLSCRPQFQCAQPLAILAGPEARLPVSLLATAVRQHGDTPSERADPALYAPAWSRGAMLPRGDWPAPGMRQWQAPLPRNIDMLGAYSEPITTQSRPVARCAPRQDWLARPILLFGRPQPLLDI